MSTNDFIKQHGYLFWDVDINELSLAEHVDFIVARVLEKGDRDCVKWLFGQYRDEEIKNVVQRTKNISAQTKNLWITYFNLNE